MPKKINLTGQRFGRLSVIGIFGKNNKNRILKRIKQLTNELSLLKGYLKKAI